MESYSLRALVIAKFHYRYLGVRASKCSSALEGERNFIVISSALSSSWLAVPAGGWGVIAFVEYRSAALPAAGIAAATTAMMPIFLLLLFFGMI